MEYIKNPVVIGLFIGISTYFYMHWENDNKFRKIQEKDPDAVKPQINLLMPFVIGAIGFLFMFIYLQNKSSSVIQQANQTAGSQTINLPKIIGSHGVHILHKNSIRMPDTDVFIDIVKF
jgi:hypothetical protein